MRLASLAFISRNSGGVEVQQAVKEHQAGPLDRLVNHGSDPLHLSKSLPSYYDGNKPTKNGLFLYGPFGTNCPMEASPCLAQSGSMPWASGRPMVCTGPPVASTRPAEGSCPWALGCVSFAQHSGTWYIVHGCLGESWKRARMAPRTTSCLVGV